MQMSDLFDAAVLLMQNHQREIWGGAVAALAAGGLWVVKRAGAAAYRAAVWLTKSKPLGLQVELLLESIKSATLVESTSRCLTCGCDNLCSGCPCVACDFQCLQSHATRIYADGRVVVEVNGKGKMTVPYSKTEKKRIVAAYVSRRNEIQSKVADSLRDAAATGNQPVSVKSYRNS